MKEILGKLEAVYNELTGMLDAANKRAGNLTERETAVLARESRVNGIESAQAVLDEAKAVMAKVDQAKKDLTEERASFENDIRAKRQVIANETGRLAELQDKEKQLAKDQQKLNDDRVTLEQEKLSYKEVLKNKFIEHFKNTGNLEA